MTDGIIPSRNNGARMQLRRTVGLKLRLRSKVGSRITLHVTIAVVNNRRAFGREIVNTCWSKLRSFSGKQAIKRNMPISGLLTMKGNVARTTMEVASSASTDEFNRAVATAVLAPAVASTRVK